MNIPSFGRVLAAAAAMAVLAAHAQQTVNMPIVVELTGGGAVSGTNWRDGATMAIDEINAKGGILGRKIVTSVADTQSNPGVSRAQVQRAIDADPYVILGPIFSGSVKVNMLLAQQAEVPQFSGGEAAELTQMGNPYFFRTSFGQQIAMPKIVNYLADGLKAKSVAIVWVNNDFGKGGRDGFLKAAAARGIKVAADISTEQGQVDFAADVVKVKNAKPDALFIYLNEEESARMLREARKQAVAVPIIGDTNLLSQKVVELAGDAANGVRGHISLSAEAPIPAVQEFRARFLNRFKYVPDHNGIKGYTAVYAVKYATQKQGKFDRKLLAKTMHGLTITPKDEPGILMETSWDDKGEVDRISFLGEVVGGKQTMVQTLPKLGK
ncbi:ABC transporter substrate-binding protein [Caenimonas terrae]|uniref:ABC transporter substrate-binding protein n=1 Tax=Caenimonas terrae TaxID=696074 RepID=A0ABW0NJJ4_9BURK